jgi:hypothetical protein
VLDGYHPEHLSDRPDLVVTEALTDTLNVLLGNGDGTFQAPRQFPVEEACIYRRQVLVRSVKGHSWEKVTN